MFVSHAWYTHSNIAPVVVTHCGRPRRGGSHWPLRVFFAPCCASFLIHRKSYYIPPRRHVTAHTPLQQAKSTEYTAVSRAKVGNSFVEQFRVSSRLLVSEVLGISHLLYHAWNGANMYVRPVVCLGTSLHGTNGEVRLGAHVVLRCVSSFIDRHASPAPDGAPRPPLPSSHVASCNLFLRLAVPRRIGARAEPAGSHSSSHRSWSWKPHRYEDGKIIPKRFARGCHLVDNGWRGGGGASVEMAVEQGKTPEQRLLLSFRTPPLRVESMCVAARSVGARCLGCTSRWAG